MKAPLVGTCDDKAAARFFRQASATDLADTHAAIDGGIHIAALGGVWMVAVLGFAGLSMVDDGIRLAPNLPAGWSSLTFAIQWRGRQLSIGIDRAGQTVSATLLSGDAMTVTVGSERHRLGPGLQLLVGVDASSAPSSKATGPLERTKAALA